MCAPHDKFVHLHVHSHYSLLDGLSKVEDLVAKAKELGMTALALTDHGVMYGAIEFYKACKDAGIKPIIGVEAYIANRTRFDREPSVDNKRYHLTLLARNGAGYKNLMKMVSKSYLEGFYYKPRMDKDLLKEYADGIICLSGCPGSEFITYLREGRNREARELIQFYIDIFGQEHVFIELMNHKEVEWYDALVPEIKKIAEEFKRPIVGTWDSHYLCTDDVLAHDTLLKINTNNANFKMDGDYSFIDQKKACEIFSHTPESVDNTALVADLVDIDIEMTPWRFPVYPIPEGTTYDSELRRETIEGLERKGFVVEGKVSERVEFELNIIKEKGFSSYFLVEADMVNAATRMGIYTNTRGSAAGSLVSFATGITNIDPLKYKLPFERFLNPLRPGIPDIDLDIADDRRDDLIGYLKERYGQNAVAQIGTFGTMMARGAVRDVARALGYPYATADKISKLIPMGSQGFAMTIDRAMGIDPELEKMYKEDRATKEIIDLAKKLEGNVRHISVHAAGVIISPTGDITDFTPIQYDPKAEGKSEGKIITQYDMYSGGRDGVVNLPKFDLLGLRNLTFIADTVNRVKKIRGIDIDMENLPLDDAKVFEMLSRGETMGVFQMAGSGMTKWIKDLRPTKIEDLMAMVALYRPGPMEVIPEYIARKRNPKLIKYPDPRLVDDLEASYGLLVYQDDVLMASIRLAGYTWLDADKFRKAMGKKIPEEMEKEKDKFYKGCREYGGLDDKKIDDLWHQIEPFAAYGFNKAHAASYGQLSYRTAWLKANYPAEYMTACMTAESGDIETVSEYIAEAKKMGFTILPPNVNESYSDFTVVVENGEVTKNIRFGLNNIKNLGTEIGKAIIAERKANGQFTGIENFLERVLHKNLNKKSLEALIMTGAMDLFGERGQLLANMESLLEFNKELARSGGDQVSLFAGMSDAPKAILRMKESSAATKNESLAWEKELLGLYVTGHPLEQFAERFKNAKITIGQIKSMERAPGSMVVAGIIEECKEIFTKKNNDKMAFLRIADLTGSMECVIFPKTYEEFKDFCKVDKLVMIKGEISDRNGERSMLIDKIKVLE